MTVVVYVPNGGAPPRPNLGMARFRGSVARPRRASLLDHASYVVTEGARLRASYVAARFRGG